MLRNFFAASNFLGLLRYWDEGRSDGEVPLWNGDLTAIPAPLLPNLIIVSRRPALTYEYIGRECRVQFGGDPTHRTIAETLSPEHAAYITDIIEGTLQRGWPIFSASVLHLGTKTKTTGRLVAPFRSPDSPLPNLIMSAHLAGGDRFAVTEVAEPGSIVETQRLLIAGVKDIRHRLEEAGRYHRLSRLTGDRRLATEWDKIAASLGADVLVPLDAFKRDGTTGAAPGKRL